MASSRKNLHGPTRIREPSQLGAHAATSRRGSVVTSSAGPADVPGLQYRRARYYDPLVGQFTQLDPIGMSGGLNLYGYANSDPVNFRDPSGLSVVSQSCADGQSILTCQEGIDALESDGYTVSYDSPCDEYGGWRNFFCILGFPDYLAIGLSIEGGVGFGATTSRSIAVDPWTLELKWLSSTAALTGYEAGGTAFLQVGYGSMEGASTTTCVSPFIVGGCAGSGGFSLGLDLDVNDWSPIPVSISEQRGATTSRTIFSVPQFMSDFMSRVNQWILGNAFR